VGPLAVGHVVSRSWPGSPEVRGTRGSYQSSFRRTRTVRSAFRTTYCSRTVVRGNCVPVRRASGGNSVVRLEDGVLPIRQCFDDSYRQCDAHCAFTPRLPKARFTALLRRRHRARILVDLGASLLCVLNLRGWVGNPADVGGNDSCLWHDTAMVPIAQTPIPTSLHRASPERTHPRPSVATKSGRRSASIPRRRRPIRTADVRTISGLPCPPRSRRQIYSSCGTLGARGTR